MSEAPVGEQILALARELFPICRSITGEGVRQTLRILGRHIPLQIREVPSGTRVFDWTVPKEWNIREAYVAGPNGQRLVDFRESNLHVLNYSAPIDRRMPLEELKGHLHTLPEHPDWIPYKTSYYKEDWGFCLSHNQYLALPDGEYHAVIDSALEQGSMSYGELLIRGKSEEEILLSTHVCHPSMANDNLSGVGVATFLARQLQHRQGRYSYRFLFIPGTIGAITWLALNPEAAARIRHGLVLTGLGDPGALTYKKSRRGDAEVDKVAQYVLRRRDPGSDIREFSPYGYDERQYCSPGFNLPVGRLSRTPYAEYPQYHTSADDLTFVSSLKLGDSFEAVMEILAVLEGNEKPRSLNPFCEPQLGKRALYEECGPQQLALLWVLNLADGQHSLLRMAERSGLELESLRAAAETLRKWRLVE